MVTCATYSSNVDCLLTLTNEYNIKLTVLGLLLIYSAIVFYFSRYIDAEKSYMHFWGYYLSKVLPILYIVFLPLFYLFLLSYNISLEIFITILVSFYLLGTALFIGVAIYSGSSFIWRMFGFDDWNEFKDHMREKRSLRKYG